MQIVLLNLIYDLSAGCTSLVAQNSLGQILHARNLDCESVCVACRAIRLSIALCGSCGSC